MTNSPNVRRRSLIAACSAHAIHDGLTDVIYVLLPVWQAQFAISLAMVGLLRGAYSGMMAGFQLLASRLAKRWGRERMLIGGTALAGIAYLISGMAGGLTVLLISLLLGGLGASTQHPLASSIVTDTHEAGGGVKEALAQYNFAGDIGKTLVPGAVGLLLVVVSWQASVVLIGCPRPRRRRCCCGGCCRRRRSRPIIGRSRPGWWPARARPAACARSSPPACSTARYAWAS
ncbi:MFS transporter [Duganella sp. BJB1802]|uniref:MFS transporter n=1 Tax=Duganella sp. BJB1802 TaxID=2744575 RepID=UPI002810BCD8|nr:MFS transporter [Duganella sp. BJB1802]